MNKHYWVGNLERGDTLRIGVGAGRKRDEWMVWHNDTRTSTITLATGWRLTYLRLIHKPLRRIAYKIRCLSRFLIDAATLLWDGASPRDATRGAWCSSRYGR